MILKFEESTHVFDDGQTEKSWTKLGTVTENLLHRQTKKNYIWLCWKQMRIYINERTHLSLWSQGFSLETCRQQCVSRYMMIGAGFVWALLNSIGLNFKSWPIRVQLGAVKPRVVLVCQCPRPVKHDVCRLTYKIIFTELFWLQNISKHKYENVFILQKCSASSIF